VLLFHAVVVLRVQVVHVVARAGIYFEGSGQRFDGHKILRRVAQSGRLYYYTVRVVLLAARG
jgi:hypothetical protein